MRTGTVVSTHKWLQHPSELVARYNSWDCKLTADLRPHMEEQLRKSGNWDYWTTRFWPLVPIVTAMQSRGLGHLDREARNQMRARLRSEISKLEKEILDGVVGDYTDKVFNSPKQLGRLLYGEWGLPTPPVTRSRRANSTDLQALAWVLEHLRKRDEPHRLRLHDLFHRSRLQTVLERYLVIEGDPDGRVRPTIKLYGTETMRFAYAGGPGEAIQQWPPECRHLIRAAPGKVFVARDYSQLEARILAVLSNDRPSLEAFAAGRDVHTQNTLDLFGLTLESFLGFDGARQKALRNYAKTFLYGISYGGKADSIKMKVFCPCYRCAEKAPPQVNLAREEVRQVTQRWEQVHFAVMDWRAKLVDSVFGYGQNRVWVSPFGYHRRFWEPRDEGERSLMNFPMQHCGAQIINAAMVRLRDVPLVLQMHDELVAEVPEADADSTLERMRIEMEAPVVELGRTIFPTEGKVGATWADLK